MKKLRFRIRSFWIIPAGLVAFALIGLILTRPAGILADRLNPTTFVNAIGGLRVRSEPSLQGKKVGLIPDGSPVEVLKEESKYEYIGGRPGHWTRIQYRDLDGYVFGGFLSNETAECMSVDGLNKHPGKLKLKKFDETEYASILLKPDGTGSYSASGVRIGANFPLTWTKMGAGIRAVGQMQRFITDCPMSCQGAGNAKEMDQCVERCEANLIKDYGQKATIMEMTYLLTPAKGGSWKGEATGKDVGRLPGKKALDPEYDLTMIQGELDCLRRYVR